jgi:hypothetical protein
VGVFENRLPRGLFGAEMEEETGNSKQWITNNEVIICILQQMLLNRSNVVQMLYIRNFLKNCFQNLKGGDQWGEQGVNAGIILKRIFNS